MQSEARAKRYVVALGVGVVVCGAFFHWQDRPLAAESEVSAVTTSESHRARPAEMKAAGLTRASSMAERLLTGKEVKPRETSALPGADPLRAPFCEDVSVSIVSQPMGEEQAWATLVEPGGVRGMRSVGSRWGEHEVLAIGSHPLAHRPTVLLRKNQELCQAQLFAGEMKSARAESGQGELSHAQLKSSPGREPREDLRREIGKLRVVPDRQGGETLGFRVFGVDPGGLFATFGLVNGDRIEAINGMPVKSQQDALFAYAQFRAADELEVKVYRRGRHQTLRVRIV